MSLRFKGCLMALVTSLSVPAWAAVSSYGVSDGGGNECAATPEADFHFSCDIRAFESGCEYGTEFDVTPANVIDGRFHLRQPIPSAASSDAPKCDRLTRIKEIEAKIEFCHEGRGHSLIFSKVTGYIGDGRPVTSFSGIAVDDSERRSLSSTAIVKYHSEKGPEIELAVDLFCRKEFWTPRPHD